jgi:hypothetical protein
MSNNRTNIRNALVALLTGTAPSYTTLCEDRIYPNRSHNIAKAKLPAMRIFDESESGSPADLSSKRYRRKISTRIEILVESSTNLDSTLDTIAGQVEDIIAADRSLNGTALAATYISTELQFDSSGEKKLGLAVLNFQIDYLA